MVQINANHMLISYKFSYIFQKVKSRMKILAHGITICCLIHKSDRSCIEEQLLHCKYIVAISNKEESRQGE